MANPETRGNETATALRKGLRRLVIATIILYLVMVGIGYVVWSDGRSTNKALCAYRNDLQRRQTASTDFLKEHPQGVAGLSGADLATSINNQQHAIDALSDLDCPPPSPVPTP